MDIGAIKARIAELEQRKAERNAMRGYRDVSYLDYIAQGDRSGFDRIDAEEQAYRNMLKQQAQQERMLGLQQSHQERMLGLQQEQQDKMLDAQQNFTAKENALNRAVTLAGIRANNSGYGRADETSKLMREIEYAQAEYDAAKDNLELGNPTSEANYKKAASKYNYWIKQLPQGFEGYSPFTLDVEEIGTSPRIKAQREEEAHNQNVSDLKTLMDSELGAAEWTQANVDKINEYLAQLDPEKDKVVIAEYRNKVRDKGETKESKNRKYMTTLRSFANSYNAAGNEEQSELQKEKPKLYKDAKARGLIK